MPGIETLWTRVHGSGPPLVLLHGGPGLWDDFDPLAAMVDDLVTVHRFDQRGCGRSGGGPPFSVDAAVEDVDALRADWGFERWTLAGHSWGAGLALAYAVTHPERVERLVYLAGTGLGDDWRDDYRAERERRLSPEQAARLAELEAQRAAGDRSYDIEAEACTLSWSPDFADRERALDLARSLLTPDLRVNYEANAALNRDWRRWREEVGFRDRVARLDVPTLVVHGDGDPRPAWAAKEVASALPRARFALLPGVGHVPWLERPELLRDVLRGFLRDTA